MDIRITPSMAQEIKYMFDDWDEVFAKDNKLYQEGYINSTKDFLAILNITMDDIEEILK